MPFGEDSMMGSLTFDYRRKTDLPEEGCDESKASVGRHLLFGKNNFYFVYRSRRETKLFALLYSSFRVGLVVWRRLILLRKEDFC